MFKTFARVALILLGLFFLLIAALVILLQTPMAGSLVENRLRAWVHPALQVNGKVGVTFLPRFGLDLQDITIPSQAGTHPAVSIRRVQWQAAWQPLFDRTLSLESLYIEGVEAFRSGPTWALFMSEVSQVPLVDASQWFDWFGRKPRVDETWRVIVRQALVEDVAVFGTDGDAQQVQLATLKQLEIMADGSWPKLASSRAKVGFRQLMVNDADAFGHTPALLEQLGIATNGTWDVMAMDSQWQLESQDLLRLTAFEANGAWGALLASDGTIELATGQMAIPMRATLTNAPKFRSRALEINVRQSQMQFELTGTFNNPGVQWLNQRR
jgi:hypothetical protein